MTSIDFYFNAGDRLQVACRLAGKALRQGGGRMLIYAPDADTASRIDKLLWTWPAIGFVPHCAARAALAAETPVLIGSGTGADAEAPQGCELLLNLGAECPPHFERFSRVFEVVSLDPDEKARGRSRYKFYQERGYKIANHDLAQAGSE
jgi:DNA polymerase-3 subunit chi